MSETNGNSGREPERIFSELRDRPTPELDSRGLWRRIEGQLTPRSAARWTRWLAGWSERPLALRLAYGVAAVATVALAAWAATLMMQPEPSGGQFVLLTPDDPAGETAPQVPDPQATADAAAVEGARSTGDPLQLDVRLVRGYDGAPPPDVRSAQALGVGGADALRDVRTRIELLLPFEGFGIVGAWQGSVAPGDVLDIELSADYRLVARAAAGGEASRGILRLNDMELAVSGQPSVSGDLSLEPGEVYTLGVLAGGVETRDLVLLIRARTSGEERR
jgi:hypothetical protein